MRVKNGPRRAWGHHARGARHSVFAGQIPRKFISSEHRCLIFASRFASGLPEPRLMASKFIAGAYVQTAELRKQKVAPAHQFGQRERGPGLVICVRIACTQMTN
jgi:hypothetical protein